MVVETLEGLHALHVELDEFADVVQFAAVEVEGLVLEGHLQLQKLVGETLVGRL